METRTLGDCPAVDHEEIRKTIADYGADALVLRIITDKGKEVICSDARKYMLSYRKEHGELPKYDQVWVGV